MPADARVLPPAACVLQSTLQIAAGPVCHPPTSSSPLAPPVSSVRPAASACCLLPGVPVSSQHERAINEELTDDNLELAQALQSISQKHQETEEEANALQQEIQDASDALEAADVRERGYIRRCQALKVGEIQQCICCPG